VKLIEKTIGPIKPKPWPGESHPYDVVVVIGEKHFER